MRILDRKLIRDLLLMKGQVLAIMMVIAAGVATFVMSMCAYKSLTWSQAGFYHEFRFADVFSAVRRAPASIIPRIQEITGVATVEARLTYDVLLHVPQMTEPATARLISVPDSGENKLNKLHVARGRMLEPHRTGEVVVSEVFADAHGFIPGDTVQAILNGRSQDFTIVGIVLSPEYVIQVQPGSIMPDAKRFGILWIGQRELEAAYDMTGAFNSVSLKLSFSSNPAEVVEHLDRLLKPFGSIGGYTRDQQISHQYLSDEITQLRGMAVMAPAIFLSVAAFLLNIVMSRMISQQREQVAALKAFGYSSWEVGAHYMNFVLIISLGGTIAGTIFGIWLASGMTELYHTYYRFPSLELRIDRLAVATAFLLTTAAAMLGTWVAVGHAIRLPPAEAMRPEPPASYRPTLLERILPGYLFSPEMRMVIRNVSRTPLKAALSVAGIAMAVAVMILGSFSLDAVNYMLDFQFNKAQRQDLSVTFVEPASSAVVYEMRSLPGVLDSETMRSIATRVHYENRSKRVAIVGLEPEPRLFRLLDTQARPVRPPEFGIMLNNRLAEILGVEPGDVLSIEVLDEKRPVLNLEVTKIVEEYSGANAYMSKQHLHQLLQESNVASGAFLKVDPNRIDQVFHQLQLRPGVASVAVKAAIIDSFQEAMQKSVLIMRSFIAGFAAVIAVGVVYNSARISLSERSRDLATLRVIGFSQREVSSILLAEIFLFTVLAIPLGWLVGFGLAAFMVNGLDTDNYRIPLVINPSTLAMAALVVVLATMLSAWIVQRRLIQLDLIGVLKSTG